MVVSNVILLTGALKTELRVGFQALSFQLHVMDMPILFYCHFHKGKHFCGFLFVHWSLKSVPKEFCS